MSQDRALVYGFHDLNTAFKSMPVQENFNTRVLFEGPTENLKKLHCHVSTLKPGTGYAPHADPYDVAIIVLEGCVETLGRRVEPCGLILRQSWRPSRYREPDPSRGPYVVFEFHAYR